MWPHPAGGEKQRKSCYHHKTAMVAGYDRLLFQPFMRQFVARRMNGIFSPINEFCAHL